MGAKTLHEYLAQEAGSVVIWVSLDILKMYLINLCNSSNILLFIWKLYCILFFSCAQKIRVSTRSGQVFVVEGQGCI
jgi:hypothetical protein